MNFTIICFIFYSYCVKSATVTALDCMKIVSVESDRTFCFAVK